MTRRPIEISIVAVVLAIASACGTNATVTSPANDTTAEPPPATAPPTPSSEAAPTSPVATEPLPPGELPKLTLDDKTIDALSSGPRLRVLLPTAPLPYPETATMGGALTSDDSWGYGFWWLWTRNWSEGLETPDGTPISSDWFVNVNGPPPGKIYEVPSNAVQMWASGELTFSIAPSQPCPDRSTPDWSAVEMGISVSVNGAIVANVSLVPTAADCGVPGQNLSPAQLVDLLAGLVDCTIGGKIAMTCQPVAPMSASKRAAAIEILAGSARNSPYGP